MSHADLQSEAFLALLGDALRAGPGSPQWHEAVTILRAAGGDAEADEYRLLIAAREHLESGREYRSVRPGPAFTRKVLDGVEQASGGVSPMRSPTTWIAALAIVGLAAVIAMVVYHTRPAAPADQGAGALARQYFVEPMLAGTFREALPADWRTIGEAEVVTGERGLRLKAMDGASDAYEGGGIVLTQPIAPQQAFALEAQLRGRAGEALVPQVFVSDSPAFSADRGTAPRELMWMLNSARPVVALPDGRFEGQGQPLKTLPEGYTVRLLINERYAIVEADGQRLWAGEHQLDPAQPRYVGVRFLRKGPRKNDSVGVSQVRILLPQGAER